jgi:hypothetical protein
MVEVQVREQDLNGPGVPAPCGAEIPNACAGVEDQLAAI